MSPILDPELENFDSTNLSRLHLSRHGVIDEISSVTFSVGPLSSSNFIFSSPSFKYILTKNFPRSNFLGADAQQDNGSFNTSLGRQASVSEVSPELAVDRNNLGLTPISKDSLISSSVY